MENMLDNFGCGLLILFILGLIFGVGFVLFLQWIL